MNPVVKDTYNVKFVIGIIMLLLTYAVPRKRERLKLLRNSVLLVLLKNRQIGIIFRTRVVNDGKERKILSKHIFPLTEPLSESKIVWNKLQNYRLN